MYFSVQNLMNFGMGRKTAFLSKLSDAVFHKDQTTSFQERSLKETWEYMVSDPHLLSTILFPFLLQVNLTVIALQPVCEHPGCPKVVSKIQQIPLECSWSTNRDGLYKRPDKLVP